MPVYMLHGFRWPREAIRIHIILQNLDDAAAEWLVAPATSFTLLRNFHELYPECMEHLPQLRFVEQYDPEDTSAGSGSQPHAYIADVCEEVKLGMDIDEIRGKGLSNDQWAAIMELRDKLAPDEKVAWYVVVCGDEDRWAPGLPEPSTSMHQLGSSISPASQNDIESGSDRSYEPSSTNHDEAVTAMQPSAGEEKQDHDEAVTAMQPSAGEEKQHHHLYNPKGLKKFFTMAKRKSLSTLGYSRSTENLKSNGGTVQQRRSHEQQMPQNLHRIMTHNDNDTTETIPQNAASPQTTMMPKLGAHNLNSKASDRTLNAHEQLALSHNLLSRMPEDDDDHEIITGPTDETDELAAPAPAIKHGKQQDMVSRQRHRTSMHSLKSAVRGTNPATLQNVSPIVRTHPDSFSNPLNQPSSLDDGTFTNYDHRLQRRQYENMPEEIDEEALAGNPKNVSPPASYIPSGIPSGANSIRTPRSTSPVKIANRQRSRSRVSALNTLEGNELSKSPPRRSINKTGARGRQASVQTTSNLTNRQSNYSLSSMSNTMAALYGAHEKSFKDRQSVTQEDLVAKGLDHMDFTALR